MTATKTDVTFDFTDRRVVITGAARGIGRALTEYFLGAGATVIAVDLEVEPLSDLVDASDNRLLTVAGNVADPATATAAFDRAVEAGGEAHVLINNAGVLRDRIHWKLSDDDWQTVIDVHLKGSFNFIREATPRMRAAGYGRIVNTTSYAGIRGQFGQANYSSAKAGLIGLTKAVAKEVAAFGITVNAVSPNAQTAMIEAIPEPRRSEIEAEVPMKRFADPIEIVPGVAFLASGAAGYITGTVLPIDGGISI